MLNNLKILLHLILKELVISFFLLNYFNNS